MPHHQPTLWPLGEWASPRNRRRIRAVERIRLELAGIAPSVPQAEAYWDLLVLTARGRRLAVPYRGERPRVLAALERRGVTAEARTCRTCGRIFPPYYVDPTRLCYECATDRLAEDVEAEANPLRQSWGSSLSSWRSL